MVNQNIRRGFTQNAVKNKVILNLIQDLRRSLLQLVNNMRGRFQIKFGMTNLFNNGAFTLIELLVVVLIIGILAAVAVPQYQVAVNKSRFAKLRVIGKTYINAMQVYYLENGTFPDTFDKLIVDKPAGTTLSYPTGSTCAQNDEIYCCLRKNIEDWQAAGITCAQKDYSFGWVQIFTDSSLDAERCVANKNDTNAVRLCSTLGTYFYDRNLVTPAGHTEHYNYKYYILSN